MTKFAPSPWPISSARTARTISAYSSSSTSKSPSRQRRSARPGAGRSTSLDGQRRPARRRASRAAASPSSAQANPRSAICRYGQERQHVVAGRSTGPRRSRQRDVGEAVRRRTRRRPARPAGPRRRSRAGAAARTAAAAAPGRGRAGRRWPGRRSSALRRSRPGRCSAVTTTAQRCGRVLQREPVVLGGEVGDRVGDEERLDVVGERLDRGHQHADVRVHPADDQLVAAGCRASGPAGRSGRTRCSATW